MRTTSSTSRGRCARRGFRSVPVRCSMRSTPCALPASARATDFYWTLHAVFVKRHEHTQLFDQAFRIFFRRRDYLDKLMASLVSQTPPREEDKPRPGAQRIEDALFSGLRAARARSQRGRDRRPAHGVRPRIAAEEGLRADVRGRDRRRQGRHEAAGAAARRDQDAPPGAQSARPCRRHAPHAAREPQGRRRADRSQISRAAHPPAADRRAARYFRLDEPVHPAVPAFPPRGHRCAQARAHLHVRHAAHQRDPRAQRRRIPTRRWPR